MSTLFCFGFSYTAAAYIDRYGGQFQHIAGTVRTAEKAAQLATQGMSGRPVQAIRFDEKPAVAAALADATLAIVSIPPGANGDPALALHAEALRRAKRIEDIVYLSTIGVYGDHGGAWIDETAPCRPVSPRSRERLRAERDWHALSETIERPVAILRLPGIYGPGRNALVNLLRGEARRVVKPGQVFNRVHVDDIAQAIEAARLRRANGVFNVCDDDPTPGGEPIAYAAVLLDMTPPPELDFDTIKDTLSPMAQSFYAESKRVRNTRMKEELGVTLAYPTYREGLRVLFESGDYLRGF